MDVGEVMSRARAESAADTIESHFSKASASLQFVERALATELEATYPRNVNPNNIVNRIKQLEAELPALSKECQQLFATKQDLMDTVKKNLVQNRALVRRMQVRAGLSVPVDSEDTVYNSFKEVLKEWNRSVQSGDPFANNGHVMARHDLNATVFKSKARARVIARDNEDEPSNQVASRTFNSV